MVLILLTIPSNYLFSEDQHDLRLISGSIIHKNKLYFVSTPLALLEEVNGVVHTAREALFFIVAGEYDRDVISRLLFQKRHRVHGASDLLSSMEDADVLWAVLAIHTTVVEVRNEEPVEEVSQNRSRDDSQNEVPHYKI